jgi:hypothetical protein
LLNILQKIPGCPNLLFAPVKGTDRAMVKLKEKIAEEPENKFPLISMKDLSRGSLVFKTASDLLKFKDAIVEGIESDNKFQLREIKNMFKDTNPENM